MMKKVLIILTFVIIFFLFFYPSLYPMFFRVPKEEILVIGLDGGDYEFIKGLMDENKLPVLKRIAGKGTLILFRTTSKLDSYSAWNSLAECNENSLWKELKKRNLTFGTLYWPNISEDGVFMIPDEFEGKKEWPEEVWDSKALVLFKNPFTEFLRKVYWLKIVIPRNKAEKDLVYEFYLLDRKAREFFYLREKFKPDLSFFVLSSPLRLEQYFWMYAYPQEFSEYVEEGEIKKYGDVIEKYFIEFDNFLAKVNKPGKIIIVVSNRGIKGIHPPKVVDKIDINKILEKIGVLTFTYKGEIDFQKTKAYTLEEGLDEELKIFIDEKNFEKIRDFLKDVFSEARSLPSNQKMFIVQDFEKGIILKRNISFIIRDERFSILNKTFNFDDFILRRIISIKPEEKGFLIVNKKIKIPNKMTSKDFCSLLFDLISDLQS